MSDFFKTDRKQLIQGFLATPFWHIRQVSDDTLILYNQALTHSSYANEQQAKGHYCDDYERLEFLGDRILNCAIADFLYQTYPDLSEGKLSNQIKVAKNENLAQIVKAKNLGIQPPLLRLGKNQSLEDSILADVFEALMGAIYLDPSQGLIKVHQVIRESLAQDIQTFNPAEDYMSRLNTHAQQFFQKGELTKEDFDCRQLSAAWMLRTATLLPMVSSSTVKLSARVKEKTKMRPVKRPLKLPWLN